MDFAWLQLPLLGDAEQLDQVNAATDDCKFTIPRAFTQLSYVHGFRMTLTPWVFLNNFRIEEGIQPTPELVQPSRAALACALNCAALYDGIWCCLLSFR